MKLRKTTVEEDEDFPVHQENVVHTRVTRTDVSFEDIDPLTAQGGDDNVVLEVWYLENSREQT